MQDLFGNEILSKKEVIITDYMESSREIIERAITDFKPYAIVVMFSGGDDSLTLLEVCRKLGVKVDMIIHGVTGTGIKETHDFVLKTVEKEKCQYVEANAGKSFEDYVLRKGFFGVGDDAHNFTYHLLKWTHFRKAVSENIRLKKRNRNVLFVNGTRRLESERRQKTMIDPIKKVGGGSNIWVNIINEWPNEEVPKFLEGNSIDRNPVSKLICRSGECNCGSMLQPGDAIEIGYHFPEWKKWLDQLSKAVREKGFTWGWGEPLPKGIAMEMKGQQNLFQPMCNGCQINYAKAQNNKL